MSSSDISVTPVTTMWPGGIEYRPPTIHMRALPQAHAAGDLPPPNAIPKLT
jgi:hypothetical protein